MPIVRCFYYDCYRDLREFGLPINLSSKEWDYPFSFLIVYDKEKFLEAMNKEASSYNDFAYALHGVATPIFLGRNEDGDWESAYDVQERYELCVQEYADNIAFLEKAIEEEE